MTRYTTRILVCSAGMLLLSACAPKPEAERTQHLAQEVLAREITLPSPPPLDLPLDAQATAVRGLISLGPDGLQFTGGAPEAGIAIPVDLDAGDYNRLEVEMRVDHGRECRFSWSSDLDPVQADRWTLGAAPSLTSEIFAGQSFRTYVLKLGPQDAWMGKIDKIHFAPATDRTRAVIRRMRFFHQPEQEPRRASFAGDWKEVLFGTQAPWTIRVPQNAVFETYLGMHPRAWEGTYNGVVRFLVTLDSAQESGHVLLDKKLTPALVENHRDWVRFQRDLSDFAGEEVTLQLTIDSLDVPLGDYAFWGNPMVFADVRRDGDIPVILISCDTLRADHLSCYGHERETSPRLDAWAAEDAVIFENAITPVTWTLPSHMTMLTGLYPKNHRTTKTSNLPPDIETLPEQLRDAGYLTGAFTGINYWFLPERGFEGFDQHNLPSGSMSFRHIYATANRLQTWLESFDTSRLFLFFHNFDIHWKNPSDGYEDPYGPGDDEFLHFSKESYEKGMFGANAFGGLRGTEIIDAFNYAGLELSEQHHLTLRLLYDDAIRMVDQSIHEFFALLKQQGRYDNALIIVTSDHGEDLNDHGIYGHRSVYEVDCRVPLLIKLPDRAFAGTRFTPQVETTDLYATILDVLGLPEEPARDGHSLLRVLRGEIAPRTYTHVAREHDFASRTNAEKLIYRHGETERPYRLFDLINDPAEQQDRYAEASAAAEPLKEDLHEFYPNPTEGWRISMDWGTSVVPMRLLIDADSPFTLYWTTPRSEMSAMHYELGDPPLLLDSATQPFVDVVVRTASTRAQLRVEIASGAPFEVFRGAEAVGMSQRYATTLDPTANHLPMPDLPQDQPHNVVGIWFERPMLEQEAAPAPDAETRELLEGFGYL